MVDTTNCNRQRLTSISDVLFDFFLPMPSLSTVSSVHITLCLLGPPLSFNTPTGGLLGLLAVEGPASDAGVGVIVIVRDADSAARGP